MKDTRKLMLLPLLLLPLFVGGDYFLRYHMILPGFEELEQREAAKDITRCKTAIQQEVQQIEKLSTDWAIWDDLYRYALDRNAAFAASNFTWETLPNTGIHLIYVINPEREVVYRMAVTPADKKEVDLQELPAEVFPADHFLLHDPNDASSLSGILLTAYGPLCLTSHNIFTSSGHGPSHGTLVFGRFLDEETVQKLRQQTQVNFTLRNPRAAPFSEAERRRVHALADKPLLMEAINTKTLLAFGLLTDLRRQPALLITAAIPRHIMEKGRVTARFASTVLLASVGLIIGSLVLIMMVLHGRSRRKAELIEALVQERTDELRMSKERLRALSDASFEAIFLFEKGICLEQNHAAEQMFGYTDDEVIGLSPVAGIIPEDRERVLQAISANEEKPYEVTALRKDGTTFPVQIQARTATYRGRTVRVTALRDISEQKRAEREQQLLEDKLRQSQKMESLGLLAGGVAHDLNNILSGIVSYPDLILMTLPEESPLYKPITLIKESGKRAAEVVDDLLTLARGVSSTKETNNLNAIVSEYLDSPEFHNLQALHRLVTVKTQLEPELLNISCSAIHVKKCLMNLVTNAAEAIKGAGTIVISTRNQYRETPLGGHPEMQQGEYALLAITDTGTGIPEESLDRIFEPFYSRKVAGRSGTGLGLAIAWSTVHDHGGGITVDSGGTGTTFELYFPATRERLGSSAEAVAIDRHKGNREKILVVDDDERQRTIALQILELLNYSGHAVGSGEGAIRYLSQETADLVILDMIMDPGMNGCETYRRILELHPGQKAIITSGFSESNDAQMALSLGAGGFLKKPYLIGKLALLLHNVLRNHHAEA